MTSDQKTETDIKRLTEGGNIIDYQGEVNTSTSYLTTMKLHVNSAISDLKSGYICIDVKYFYSNNCMDIADFKMIQITMTSQEFIDK